MDAYVRYVYVRTCSNYSIVLDFPIRLSKMVRFTCLKHVDLHSKCFHVESGGSERGNDKAREQTKATRMANKRFFQNQKANAH